MFGEAEPARDLAALVVPQVGRLVATGDRYEPYRLENAGGTAVEAVAFYFRDLLAAGRSVSTLRSYGMDLLRWLRFCWAVDVPWSRATRVDARDFCRWLLVAGKPVRPHWRTRRQAGSEAGSSVAVTTATGGVYAASVRAHSETVLRGFYDVHLLAGSGPIINPFPLDRSRRGGRAHAHRNPMEPRRNERSGRYRPKVPARIPRSIPDSEFCQRRPKIDPLATLGFQYLSQHTRS